MIGSHRLHRSMSTPYYVGCPSSAVGASRMTGDDKQYISSVRVMQDEAGNRGRKVARLGHFASAGYHVPTSSQSLSGRLETTNPRSV